MSDFSHWKLSELDWDILEGLEEVLSVSRITHGPYSFHITIGSPRVSTYHVVRIHSGFVACDVQFRVVYDRMGKTREATPDPPALDGNRLAVGEEILHSNG